MVQGGVLQSLKRPVLHHILHQFSGNTSEEKEEENIFLGGVGGWTLLDAAQMITVSVRHVLPVPARSKYETVATLVDNCLIYLTLFIKGV